MGTRQIVLFKHLITDSHGQIGKVGLPEAFKRQRPIRNQGDIMIKSPRRPIHHQFSSFIRLSFNDLAIGANSA